MAEQKQENRNSLHYYLFDEPEQHDKIFSIFNKMNKENEYDYKKGKILIIDDNKFIRDIIIEYLQLHDFQNFICAGDGELGLNAVYTYFPDIILCDYNIPKMNGGQLHNIISKNPEFKDIPFIFISATNDKHIIDERLKMGAIDFLIKPIGEYELLNVIEQHLKQYMENKKEREV